MWKFRREKAALQKEPLVWILVLVFRSVLRLEACFCFCSWFLVRVALVFVLQYIQEDAGIQFLLAR